MTKVTFCQSILTLISINFSIQTAIAQTYQPTNRPPVADNTLKTQVSANGNNFDITGGLRKGQTLFHSFTDFSVPTNGQANFLNPVGNRDIITRVTGGLFSDINGLVNTNGANFFLLNPNGIIFGTNARLNVGRAFMATTANGIGLVDAGGSIITFGTNPNSDAPLLSIAPNVLFNVSQLTLGGGNGQISNFGTLQTTNPAQYIGLIGGNVSLNGGKIHSPGGRVELGGLSAAGTVIFNQQGAAQLPPNVARADVSLTNGSNIDVTGAGGGDIALNAHNLDIRSGSTLNAGILAGFGTPATVAGDIKIDATGDVRLADTNNGIINVLNANAIGQGGGIEIVTQNLTVTNGAQLQAITRGKGDAGNIKITATGNILFDGGQNQTRSAAFSTVELGAVGKGGAVEITTNNLAVTNGAALSASTRGQGDAGNIKITATGDVYFDGIKDTFSSQASSTVERGAVGNGGTVEIKTKNLAVANTAKLNASTLGTGDAGSVKITATGNVYFDGIKDNERSSAFSSVEQGAVGKGGGIEITTQNLAVTNGAQLTTSTKGQGDAGSVKITATGNVSFDGGQNTNRSGAFSSIEPAGVGKGGGIEIMTKNLTVTNGAQLQAITRAKGDAGSIKITATGDVYFDGIKDNNRSAAFSSIESGAVGKGGDIELKTKNLIVTNGGFLSASTRGQGNAGNVKITATGNVYFDGIKDNAQSGASSTVEQGAVGKGGAVEITATNLAVTNGAELTASTTGTGDAGSVKITATENVLFNRGQNNLRTGAFSSIESGGVGKGGGVEITTTNLTVTNGAQLQAITRGQGDAGSIKITATGDVYFDGGKDNNRSAAFSSVEQGAVGKGGDIELKTKNLIVTNGAQLTASTRGKGDAGSIKITATGNILFDGIKDNALSAASSTVEQGAVGNGGGIEITTNNLIVTNGGLLSASTRGKGDAGNLKITATGNVLFDGIKDNARSAASSTLEQGAVGKGGTVDITATNLAVRNGAQLTASTKGQGDAGSVKITATENVLFDGGKENTRTGAFSSIESGGVGKGGGIELKTKNLAVTNGAQLQAITRGKGDAGSIRITATGDVYFNGTKDNNRSAAFSSVEEGAVGKGGGIEITTNNLLLTNGGLLSVSTRGQGDAGSIILNAKTIKLNQGGISLISFSSKGGDLNINTQDYLLLQNNSSISTESTSTGKDGNGGNITIDSPLIIAALGDNNISANASAGNGGRVNITSQGLFGIQYRPKGQDSPLTNDITASSTFGQSGIVNIDTPGSDPGRDSTQLPNTTTDASNQISQACSASTRQNKLTVTGRGGLPPNADDLLTSDVVWQDARAVNRQSAVSSATINPTKLAAPAVGWVFDGKGKVTLIAAGAAGNVAGTSVVCPQEVTK